MLTYFQNSFADRLVSKFAIISSLNIPPLLRNVATLPCKRSFKNCHAQGLTEVMTVLAGDEEFCGRRSSHLEHFTSEPQPSPPWRSLDTSRPPVRLIDSASEDYLWRAVQIDSSSLYESSRNLERSTTGSFLHAPSLCSSFPALPSCLLLFAFHYIPFLFLHLFLQSPSPVQIFNDNGLYHASYAQYMLWPCVCVCVWVCHKLVFC